METVPYILNNYPVGNDWAEKAIILCSLRDFVMSDYNLSKEFVCTYHKCVQKNHKCMFGLGRTYKGNELSS